MELSVEKSEELAQQIECMKLHLLQMDAEYVKALSVAMGEQSQRQATLAVLNASHDPLKNNLLFAQGNALNYLYYFIRALKQCDELKSKIADNAGQRDEINKLFI